MGITNLKWGDAAKTQVIAQRDGHTIYIPADLSNTDFAALDPTAIAAYVAPPAPVPGTISFAQLVTALVAKAFITEAEGEAWLQGSALPPAVLGVVSALPADQQFPAKAKLYRMSEADRESPLVAAIAATQNLTAAQIDDFFRFAATL